MFFVYTNKFYAFMHVYTFYLTCVNIFKRKFLHTYRNNLIQLSKQTETMRILHICICIQYIYRCLYMYMYEKKKMKNIFSLESYIHCENTNYLPSL